MQTRSTTRKLANALAANSDVSNSYSAKNTPGRRSKIANSDKNSRSKDKVKVRHHMKSEEKKAAPTDEMGPGLRKRRSQRLMTEEEKSVKNDKEVAEQSSSVSSSGEQRQGTKKDAVTSPGSKKNKATKRASEDATDEVKRVAVEKVKELMKEKKEKKEKKEEKEKEKKGKKGEKEKEKKEKKEKKANKIKEETEEERKVKLEVTSKEETDADSRPPIAKKIKLEDIGEVTISKVKSGEFPSLKSDRKIGIIKREVSPQMQLLDAQKDIKNEDQSSETEPFSRSSQSETKMVSCKKEKNEEEKERGPTLEAQRFNKDSEGFSKDSGNKDSEGLNKDSGNKDSEPEAEEESVNEGSEVSEKEAASTSAPKETQAPKAKETVVQGFDIRIERLSDDFINSVRDKKLVIGGSRPEQKKDKKKKVKEPCKRKISDKSFIPLNTSGATKFFVADMTVLKKSGVNHPAMDVKRDLLYGPRIKRVPYSKVLAYNMKTECRKMRY